MNAVERLVDKIYGGLDGLSSGAVAIEDLVKSSKEAVETAVLAAEDAMFAAKESIINRELASDDAGWETIGFENSDWNMDRSVLLAIVRRSRLMFLMNPLIKRAVTVQELYVWGSGYTIKAQDKIVQGVLDDFFKATKNQKVIGDSWDEREREQRIDGNTFFVFFKNPMNGAARIRKIPLVEIEAIIFNPEDRQDVWYYKRRVPGASNCILYPDIDYNPTGKPAKYKDDVVSWDNPVLHVKTGGLSEMSFGLPELYSALNWATAYKEFLSNFATIMKAFTRLAMKITGGKGKAGDAAAKSKLGTTVSASGGVVDKNPPMNTASWYLASGGMDVAPIKTANSTTGPDEARALRSMVASGSDTPEHFFGDSDIGNLATSTTLDRPTELKMVSRQDMWRKVILRMANQLMIWSATSPRGKLNLAGYTVDTVRDLFDNSCIEYTLVAPGEGSLEVKVTFPSILSRDVIDRVRSVVMAATLNGSLADGIIPDRAQLYQLLMTALDEKDAEALTARYYPEPVIQGFIDPADKLKNETLTAQGRKELGDAALDQAAAAKTAAENPPKPAATAPKKTT